jgi:hypothetical protein
MSYDAGKAVALYTIDDSGAIAAAERIGKIWQGIAKSQSTFGGAQKPITDQEVKYAQALARTAEAEARRASATAKKVAEDAKAGISTARQATEEQKLAKETANAAAAQDRAAKASIQLAKARDTKPAGNNGSPALPRTFAGFTPQGFNQALGAAGLVTFGPQLIGQAVQFGEAVGQDALALRETQNSLKAVAGDTQTYNRVLAAAREQQRLFGGSLQENIEGLQGLTITSRSSGAQLKTLIDLSQRLGVLDPAQGASGARIALNEALSGDPTSLAKRYEIPRVALAKLRDTTIPVEERLKVIDSFLNGVGITSASVAGKVDQVALAYRGLSAELSDSKLTFGNELATSFSGAASGLARLIGLINQNPQAIAELKNLRGGVITDQDVEDVRKGQRATKINESITGASNAGAEVDPLSGAIFKSAEGAAAANALGGLRDRILEVGSASESSFTGVQNMIQGFTDGRVKASQLASILDALAERERAGSDAEDRRAQQLNKLSGAEGDATKAIFDGIQKKIQSTQESQKLANVETTLANIGVAVKLGLLTSAEGATQLALQFGFARDQALGLVNAQAQIANTGRKGADGSGSVGIIAGYQEGIKAAADLRAAQERGILQNGTYAQKLALLRQQLKGLVPDTAAYIDKQNEIIALQQGQVKGAQSTANKLNDIQAQSGIDRYRIERENLERLRDQQQDYELKRTRSEEDYRRRREGLLARGQRAEAARLKEDFERDQRREAEDFTIQRQRTLRNNQEGLGDQSTRVGVQIGKATRGRGGVGVGASIGGDAQLPVAIAGAPPAAAAPMVIQIQVNGTTNLDGQKVGDLIYDRLHERLDNDIIIDLQSAQAGSGQQVGVSGPRP